LYLPVVPSPCGYSRCTVARLLRWLPCRCHLRLIALPRCPLVITRLVLRSPRYGRWTFAVVPGGCCHTLRVTRYCTHLLPGLPLTYLYPFTFLRLPGLFGSLRCCLPDLQLPFTVRYVRVVRSSCWFRCTTVLLVTLLFGGYHTHCYSWFDIDARCWLRCLFTLTWPPFTRCLPVVRWLHPVTFHIRFVRVTLDWLPRSFYPFFPGLVYLHLVRAVTCPVHITCPVTHALPATLLVVLPRLHCGCAVGRCYGWLLVVPLQFAPLRLYLPPFCPFRYCPRRICSRSHTYALPGL